MRPIFLRDGFVSDELRLKPREIAWVAAQRLDETGVVPVVIGARHPLSRVWCALYDRARMVGGHPVGLTADLVASETRRLLAAHPKAKTIDECVELEWPSP